MAEGFGGMNPEDLAAILDELGKRLGPSGEYMFALAVRQAYIEAIAGTAFLIVAVAITVTALVLGIRYVSKDDGRNHEDRTMGVGLVVGLLSLFSAFAFINFIAYDLPRFLNPEYAAIRDILEAIGGAR